MTGVTHGGKHKIFWGCLVAVVLAVILIVVAAMNRTMRLAVTRWRISPISTQNCNRICLRMKANILLDREQRDWGNCKYIFPI